MRFPEEMMIEYKYDKIINKDKIIKYIQTVEKEELIDNYLKVLNLLVEENKINKEEAQILINACNNKKENKIELNKELQQIKQKTPNFDNITIVETKKENNDKINGYSKDINYIKYTIGETTKLYEITNDKAVSNFLKYNQEQISKMKETELLEVLTKNCKELQIKEIEDRENDNLNADSIKEEIKDILDPTVKEAFIKDQNNVLKERLKIKEYKTRNKNEKSIKYSLNSMGERIYLIGDITIKFEGPERNMKIIENKESKEQTINTNENTTYDNSILSDDKMDNNIEKISFEDKDGYNYNSELLDSIIEAIAVDVPINEMQINYLEHFLNYCVTRNEMGYQNSSELQILFDKYYNYTKENPKFLNDNVNKIMERYNNVLNRIEKKEESQNLTNENVKRLELNNNNYTSGFVVTTIILEIALLLGAILSIIILVK